ncbi:MAG: hypothetical protein ABIK89_24300 [Planctomycetota bacterium]
MDSASSTPWPSTTASRATRKRQAVHEEEPLAESELGQQVLRLRGWREELLDVVWLATSPEKTK